MLAPSAVSGAPPNVVLKIFGTAVQQRLVRQQRDLDLGDPGSDLCPDVRCSAGSLTTATAGVQICQVKDGDDTITVNRTIRLDKRTATANE